ncbi:MAG TPA: thiamine phosphate synthase, partial [Pyrinomonadaceae bacterium]|nr:thiamine phosphate synthase [Pyrinomonadaceae bacterium]
PKVYPITDTTISGLSHCEQVKRLIAGGAALIQLRDKRASSRVFYSDAQAAIEIARAADVKLIINDRVDIALALRADGVHLGQEDMPVDAARRILGDQAVIGFSTHNLEQIREALRLPIDYLAFGPIFPTTSKRNPDPVAGLDQLKRAREMVLPMPLVAIGGINRDNALNVLNAGASAVAVISAVLANPSRIARDLQQIVSSIE